MICIDTSLVIRALTDEEKNEEALSLFERWNKTGQTLVAPALIDYEVASALCRKIFMHALKEKEAIQIYHLYQELDIETQHKPEWIEKAFLLAKTFGQKTPYDFVYLAAAQELRAQLFTADKKFVELVKEGFGFVKYYLSNE